MAEASQGAIGTLYRSLMRQASMLAYLDTFWVLMLFVMFVLPVVLLMRSTPGIGRAR